MARWDIREGRAPTDIPPTLTYCKRAARVDQLLLAGWVLSAHREHHHHAAYFRLALRWEEERANVLQTTETHAYVHTHTQRNERIRKRGR